MKLRQQLSVDGDSSEASVADRLQLVEAVVSIPRADVSLKSQNLVVLAGSDDDFAVGDDVREETDERTQPRPSLRCQRGVSVENYPLVAVQDLNPLDQIDDLSLRLDCLSVGDSEGVE